MVAHMAAVAVAAPLLALALAGTRLDPASRWPVLVAPLPMMALELCVVWGWHWPAARALAAASVMGLAIEQAMFLAAGFLLWSACLGTRDAASASRRAAGIIALLLTTMHMTLLGVLIALAPRVLYASSGFGAFGIRVSAQADQHLGGIVMLLIGSASYLLGGLMLLAALLRTARPGHARP
jgi:putative membrane protein